MFWYHNARYQQRTQLTTHRNPYAYTGQSNMQEKVKGKAHSCTGTEVLYSTAHRPSRGITLLFLDHGTRRGWGVSVTPRPLFTPRERPGTHGTGGWVGPRAGLDRCGKSRPPPGFDPRTVQPVASRYTDWATRPTTRKKAGINSHGTMQNQMGFKGNCKLSWNCSNCEKYWRWCTAKCVCWMRVVRL